MIKSIKMCFSNKNYIIWLLPIFIAFILELTSLYFQHIQLLQPCVLCIYQRCALFGIIFGGLCLLSTPYSILKIGGGIMWIYSAWQGFFFAKKQNDMQLYSSPFTTCDFFVNFPSWFQLDKWIPSIFDAHGDCSEYKWYFLTLEISQWMMIIFFIYLVIPIIPIILSIKKHLKNISIIKN